MVGPARFATLMAVFALVGLAAGELRPISSAEICGRCHRAIHSAWKQSAHAQAMESPIFQDALDAAEADSGAGVRRACLQCHAPLAIQTADTTLVQKTSWEGVTCDYCHSMRSVALSGSNPVAKVEYSLVKSGPIKDATAGVHGTVYSEVHIASTACAPCHEYRNAQGFPVLTTYSEWNASRYAKEGRTCQSCHMYRIAGDVVDPRVKRTAATKVNLHQMPGSHSLDQLTRTVKARLIPVREENRLQVKVEVANRGAGHFVPTGSPLRQLILEVRVSARDGQDYKEERVYRRQVADASGTLAQREHVAFLKGAKLVSDTRLAPDEARIEAFSFPIPRGKPANIKATLSYYYSPFATTEGQKRVTFVTLSQFVP
jgi:nitrate/TMAO reductase-like tetraheme cytochrome c subunit